MIRIVVTKNSSNISIVTISGHACYNEYGKDIVCASVSSIMFCTIEAIKMFDNYSVTEELNDGIVTLKVIKENAIIDKLMQNMINLFYKLNEQYPQNIKIREVSL